MRALIEGRQVRTGGGLNRFAEEGEPPNTGSENVLDGGWVLQVLSRAIKV